MPSENWIQAVLLGLLQGVTEFLPISSSAHLLILPWLMDWTPRGLTFDVLLHGGTLVALILYFRRFLRGLVLSVFRPGRVTSPEGRLLGPLLAGTIPIVFAGLAVQAVGPEWFRTPLLTCLNLALFGGLLWISDRIGKRDRQMDALSLRDGFYIGVAQSLALMPGVSRSGVTISAALLLGLSRPEAARFAFLLGIPALAMATAAKTLEMVSVAGGVTQVFGAGELLGVLTAFLSGLAAIHFLISYLQRGSLRVFSLYRFALALLLLFWFWSSGGG